MKNINIIAMAGDGKRYLKTGMRIIKPLVKYKKKPLIYYSTKSLPRAKKIFFICKKNHFESYKLNKYFKKYFKNYKFIKLKKKTAGQAISCYKAITYIPKNHQITFGSCDYFFTFNKKKHSKLMKKFDLLVFTNKPEKNMLKNKNQYGWIKKDVNNKIKIIKCKKIVSRNPENDLVITGCFSFRNKDIFKKSFDLMIKKKNKIKNEYYMDVVAQTALILKFKVGYIQVSNYKNFGTPGSLASYEKKN